MYTQDGMRDDHGPLCLPSIEDACGIQLGLMQIMSAMAGGRIDSREGVRLLYGMQVAVQALDRVPKTPPDEIVQATQCDGVGVDIALADECLREPHEECATCIDRHGCANLARQNKKSIRDLYDEGRDRRERAEREPLALPPSHDSAAPLVPTNEAALAPAPPARIDRQKDAEMEARINKFRPNKKEADRIARIEEIHRMEHASEITFAHMEHLLDHPELPLPPSRTRKKRNS